MNTALCNIWQKSALFFWKWCYFNVFLGNTSPKVLFFKRFQTLPLNSRLHPDCAWNLIWKVKLSFLIRNTVSSVEQFPYFYIISQLGNLFMMICGNCLLQTGIVFFNFWSHKRLRVSTFTFYFQTYLWIFTNCSRGKNSELGFACNQIIFNEKLPSLDIIPSTSSIFSCGNENLVCFITY